MFFQCVFNRHISFHYGSFLKRLFAYLRVDVRFTGVQMSFELYKPQRAQLRTYVSARKTAKTCAQPCARRVKFPCVPTQIYFLSHFVL